MERLDDPVAGRGSARIAGPEVPGCFSSRSGTRPRAVTLRAAPGFALPGVTPADPHRLPDHRDKGHR